MIFELEGEKSDTECCGNYSGGSKYYKYRVCSSDFCKGQIVEDSVCLKRERRILV